MHMCIYVFRVIFVFVQSYGVFMCMVCMCLCLLVYGGMFIW